MDEDLKNIQYAPIRKPNYAALFQEIEYNGHILTDSESKDIIEFIDEHINQSTEGFPLIEDALNRTAELNDTYNTTYNTVVSVMLFVQLTTLDVLVFTKHFLLAENDYERSCMRGKLKVILNEGFKQLYGFENRTKNESEWSRLKTLMEYFTGGIVSQYEELTGRLEKHAKSSSWWKEERDLETHLDAEKLYKSRQREVIQSKVIIESLKLFDTLLAVNCFLSNVHSCLLNYLVGKYKRGELLPE